MKWLPSSSSFLTTSSSSSSNLSLKPFYQTPVQTVENPLNEPFFWRENSNCDICELRLNLLGPEKNIIISEKEDSHDKITGA